MGPLVVIPAGRYWFRMGSGVPMFYRYIIFFVLIILKKGQNFTTQVELNITKLEIGRQ